MNLPHPQTSRAWKNGIAVDSDVKHDEVRRLIADGAIIWSDFVNPTAQELAEFMSEFGVSPASIEDALAPHERTKVTRHDTHLFFTVYATQLRPHGAEGLVNAAANEPSGAIEGRLVLTRISGFVLNHGLVTVRITNEDHPELFDVDSVLRRWEEAPTLLAEGASALIYGLLDYVVDSHFDTIQDMDDALESLEGRLFAQEKTGPEFARATYGLRKDLVALRRVVLPIREVVNTLVRHRSRDGGPLDAWYDDLYDHVLRASEWTESLRDMVSTVFETNLSLQDARLNTIMKQLAAWAAIIAVPTAITGWFGQNVPYPGFQHMSGLWMSIGLIVVLSLALYAVFRKQDWL